MGYILRLPTSGAANLPTLGDIGYISKIGLKGLYLINGGTGLTDASDGGATLTQTAGSIVPPYAAGVLQFRSINGQQLSTGVTIAGPNQTIIVAAKKISTGASGSGGTQILASHRTAILQGSPASPMTIIDGQPGVGNAQNFGQQAKRPQVTYSGNRVGVWSVWGAVRDANGVSLSVDGQSPITLAYTTADPGTTTTNAVVIGDDPAGVRPVDADIGFAAVYERALPAAEIASAYKAIKRLMLAKGIAI